MSLVSARRFASGQTVLEKSNIQRRSNRIRNTDSLPFINPTGVEYPSLLRVEETALIVEFRRWSWRKLSKRLISVRIPIEAVVSLQQKKGVVADHIVLQLRSMRTPGGIPCRKPRLIEMRFAKAHWELVDSLASRLRAATVEQQLAQIDRELGRTGE